jgi:hypothetical protein
MLQAFFDDFGKKSSFPHFATAAGGLLEDLREGKPIAENAPNRACSGPFG